MQLVEPHPGEPLTWRERLALERFKRAYFLVGPALNVPARQAGAISFYQWLVATGRLVPTAEV